MWVRSQTYSRSAYLFEYDYPYCEISIDGTPVNSMQLEGRNKSIALLLYSENLLLLAAKMTPSIRANFYLVGDSTSSSALNIRKQSVEKNMSSGSKNG
jgi:hypothetical protein